MASMQWDGHRWLTLIMAFVFFLGCAFPVVSQNCSKQNPCATGCCSKSGWCGTTENHCSPENCVDTCDYEISGCSESNPCETGCCSKTGFCGFGPDYCAPDVCVTGCDSKSQCDPGFGAEWAKNAKCPLNVCCSEFGFCGTTEPFCGDEEVKKPTCSLKGATLDRVIGYYESWGSRRPCNDFWPEQIPMGVYTHINFAFAAIDPDTFEIRPSQREDIDLLLRLTNLKRIDPDLKVMIALGGWAFNNVGPTRTTFSDIARSEENQLKFFKSLVSFLATHNLDGVDLDWEYPAAEDRGGRPEDYENFPIFLARLKDALQSTGGRSELSITLPASYWYLQHFDIVKLEQYVDFFNIMSYDLHGKWDLGNEWTGNFLNAHTNLTEIDKSLDLLWRNQIDPSKVVLGLAFYARVFTVEDTSCVEPGCLFASGGEKGDCSQEVGILMNSEIDKIVQERNLTPRLYEEAAVQVLSWDDQWLAYDNKETFKLKVDYARGSCLGGVMVWAVSHDTANGKYSNALNDVSYRTHWSFPAIFATGADSDDDPYMTKVDKHPQCKWSNCGHYCPPGWKMMIRDDKWRHNDNEIMLDPTGCTHPHARRLCCPPDEKLPTCGWYNFNGGACDGDCPTDYREVGSVGTGCRSGYQAACCKLTTNNNELLNSLRLYENCEWARAPMCMLGMCTFGGSAWPTNLVESDTGSGAAVCNVKDMSWDDGWKITVQKRKYCCDQKNPQERWSKCEWRNDIGGFGTEGKKCKSGCASNQVRVAMQGWEDCHDSGAKSYCCQGTYREEHEVLIPELQVFEDAMAAWEDTPVCFNNEGGLITSSSNPVAKRKLIPFPFLEAARVETLLSDLIIGYEANTTGEIFQKKKDIFNKHIEPTWENLGTSDLLPWITGEDTYPSSELYSPQRRAHLVLCFPDAFNDMISDSPTLDCDHYEPETNDYLPADGSTGQSAVPQLSVHGLEKRDGPKQMIFSCRGKSGRKRTIKYQRQAYPSVGDWGDNEPQTRNSYDLSDWDHCHTTEVQTHNLGQARGTYATEHLVELQTMEAFMQWAIKNEEEECVDIDCDFFADFFNTKVLGDGVPDLPGLDSSHQRIPMQRVMEMLGSEYNRENFVILHESINLNKAQLWQYGKARSDVTWEEKKTKPTKGLEIIRDTIAVFNYLRTSAVWDKFKAINQNIREEMQRAQDASGKTDVDKQSVLDCWDSFMSHKLDKLSEDGESWVAQAIHDMKQYWVAENFDNDDSMKQVCIAVQEQLALLEVKAVDGIQQGGFDLGLWDSMDTS